MSFASWLVLAQLGIRLVVCSLQYASDDAKLDHMKQAPFQGMSSSPLHLPTLSLFPLSSLRRARHARTSLTAALGAQIKDLIEGELSMKILKRV